MIGKGMKDKKYNKAGEWNHVRIVKDNNVEHWFNGEKLSGLQGATRSMP